LNTSSGFLGGIPNEVALLTIQNLPGKDLVRLREVDRRACALAGHLLKNPKCWDEKPCQDPVDRAMYFLKGLGKDPTILDLPKSISHLSFRILQGLDLVPQHMGLNPGAVAVRAASLGDPDLCMRGLDLAKRPDLGRCLYEAIEGGHLQVVEVLLKRDVDVSEVEFHISIQNGKRAVAERLLVYNSDFRLEVSDLQWAAFRGKLEELHEPAERLDARGLSSPVHFAAYSGQVDAIEALHSLGYDISSTDIHVRTPLHWAAMNGHKGAVAKLLDLGCPVDGVDGNECTALNYAVQKGHIGVMKVLIQHECRMDVTDKYGKMPLHRAAMNDQAAAIKVLVESGFPIDTKDVYGAAAIHIAAENGHTEVIRALVEMECCVDSTTGHKLTALHFAARRRRTTAVKLLAEHESLLDAADNDGLRALHFAASMGDVEAIEVMVKRGCSISAVDNKGRTALHFAAFDNHTEAIRMLVERGCPLDATDHWGKTALDDAVGLKNTAAIEVLKALGSAND